MAGFGNSVRRSDMNALLHLFYQVKPDFGFTIARRPQLPPSMFFGLNVRSIGIKDHFDGRLLRRQHHNIPFAKSWGEKEPFRLKDPRRTTKEVNKRTLSKLKTYQILGPGMILLEKYVSPKDQADIVNVCDKWSMSPWGFYEPDYKEGEDYRMHMCFGRNWDPKTEFYFWYNSDRSVPPPIPYSIFSLATNAIEDAQALLDKLPSTCPDTCFVSFYPSLRGRLGFRQQYLASPDSDCMRLKLPLVSMFIGESAEFVYRRFGCPSTEKSVVLQSGDVVINGGKSRYFDHALTQIHVDTMPQPLLLETALKPGCLNLSVWES